MLTRGEQSLSLDIDDLGALKKFFRSSNREIQDKIRLLIEEGFIDFSALVGDGLSSRFPPTLGSQLHLPSAFNFCQDAFIAPDFLAKVYPIWEQGKGLIQQNAIDAVRKGIPFPQESVLRGLQALYGNLDTQTIPWKDSAEEVVVTIVNEGGSAEEIFLKELPTKRKEWEQTRDSQGKNFFTEGLEHLGHAGLAFSNCETTILFDPVFFSSNDRMIIEPFSGKSWAKIDAVFFTHFHSDHFDFASLLQIPSRTPIFVPKRTNSPFDPPMEKFLRQMGFTQVREWSAGDSATFAGGLTVSALPFVGEASELLGFSGILYGLDHKGKKALLLADGSSNSKGEKVWDNSYFRSFLADRPLDLLFSTWWQQQNFIYELSPFIPFMSWIKRGDWLKTSECCDMGTSDLRELVKRVRPKETIFYAEGGHSLFEKSALDFRVEIPLTWKPSSQVAQELEQEGFSVRQAFPRTVFPF